MLVSHHAPKHLYTILCWYHNNAPKHLYNILCWYHTNAPKHLYNILCWYHTNAPKHLYNILCWYHNNAPKHLYNILCLYHNNAPKSASITLYFLAAETHKVCNDATSDPASTNIVKTYRITNNKQYFTKHDTGFYSEGKCDLAQGYFHTNVSCIRSDSHQTARQLQDIDSGQDTV